MNDLTNLSSGLDKTAVPRAFRMNLLDRLIMPWRFPACWTLTRPEAVSLNLFLALDFVFNFGISNSRGHE